jgi:hypothetical protein
MINVRARSRSTALRRIALAGLTGVVLQASGADCPATEAETASSHSPSPAVSLDPQNIHLQPAESCTLQVMVSTPDSLSCFNCVIAFDHTLLTLVSVDEGELFEEAPFLTFFSWDQPSPDTISVSDCVLGYRSCAVGPGELVRLVFRAEGTGLAGVRIGAMALWDIDRSTVDPVVDPAAWVVVGTPTGTRINAGSAELRAYPNPFNHATHIVFTIPLAEGTEQHGVTVSIYTPAGEHVRTLDVRDDHSGESRFVWNGRDRRGQTVASGVYYAAVVTGRRTFTTRLVLLR